MCIRRKRPTQIGQIASTLRLHRSMPVSRRWFQPSCDSVDGSHHRSRDRNDTSQAVLDASDTGGYYVALIELVTPATHPVHFVDDKQARRLWKHGIPRGEHGDVSQYLCGLSDDEHRVICMCSAFDRGFRRRAIVPRRQIVTLISAIWPDGEKKISAAIANLKANGILTRSETSLRLPRCISQDGIKIPNRSPGNGLRRSRTLPNQTLVERFQGRCAYCGAPVATESQNDDEPRMGTLDYVIPISHHVSPSDEENWALSCQQCSDVKGDRTPEKWAADILQWRRSKRSWKDWWISVSATFRSWLAALDDGR